MTGRYAVGINHFEKLRYKNSEIIPFLAKLYFLMGNLAKKSVYTNLFVR